MALPIRIDKRTYRPFAEMLSPPPGAGPWVTEDRGFLSPKKSTIRLKKTFGAYLEVGGRTILIVIDEPAAAPGSDVWAFIHDVAAHLVAVYPALNQQAKDALARLSAVVFAQSPKRAFANIKNACFFYDTDELLVAGGSGRISTAYAVSNIVHDANHIWLDRNGKAATGLPAEVICWQLQVDNRVALGLAPHEVTHLQGFIAKPETAGIRINEDI